MGLRGKLVAAVEFRAGGDVFHELFKHRPHDVSKASPSVHGCDLHEGEFGHVGSVICWRYTHEEKKKRAKQVVQKIDEENKLIEFKMLEGDLMEEGYKDFLITVHVDTKEGIDLVTWTLEYEMLNDDVGHPFSMLSYFMDVTKEIETHHTTPKPSVA